MNFLELTNRVKYTLGLEDTSANDEVALAKAYINEGVVDILTRTRPYTRVIQLTLTKDVGVHDMANTILALVDLQAGGYWSPFLKPLSREDVMKAQADAIPGFAYEEPMLWVSPIPSEDVTFQAYGIFRPTPMTADMHDPSVPTFGGLAPEFHPAVVNYALWKAGEYVQHEMSQGGERWRGLYEGSDGFGGDISQIKRVLAKRVTPRGRIRRNLTGNLGALSPSGSYLGG